MAGHSLDVYLKIKTESNQNGFFTFYNSRMGSIIDTILLESLTTRSAFWKPLGHKQLIRMLEEVLPLSISFPSNLSWLKKLLIMIT